MGIGENLKRLRSKTKYSNQDIADLLGVDRNTYANWENGTTDVKSQFIPQLADIFKVKIQDLFEENRKFQINNSENSDNASIIHGSIIINIFDLETAKLLGNQLEEIVKNLKK